MSCSQNFVFRIPDRIEELEDSENFPNYYTVNICYSPNELQSRVAEAESLLKSKGTDFILESFDVFYYVIKHFNTFEQKIRDDAWIILNRALAKLQGQLYNYFENFQMDQRKYYQNKLQMLMYAFISMCELYEEEDAAGNMEVEDSRKKKKVAYKSPQIYKNNKQSSITMILKIFTLRLERLFDPAHFLNNFVNIITRFSYKLLENNSLSRFKTSILFQNVCEIIGIAVEKYQHSLNYCMKIIELLQSKESLVGTISQLVAFNIKHNRQYLLITDILEQIKSIDINELSRDSSGPRAISSFLIELGEKCTEEMFKCISDLFEFLEQDSYLLRNATLEIIATIVIKLFKSPTLVKDVHIKDKLLDKLEDHIHDVTSYTRSRVLHLWCNLSQNEAIPISRLNNVTKLIVERLEDKSCFVRKNAVHFLTLILKENPFMIMNKKELTKALTLTQSKYDKNIKHLNKLVDSQMKKVNEMIEMNVSSIDENNTEENKDNFDEENVDDQSESEQSLSKRKSDSFESLFITKKQKIDLEKIRDLGKLWFSLEKEFHDYWKKTGCRLEFGKEIQEEMPQDDLEKGFEYFRELVIQKQFEKALNVLFTLKSLYPNEKLFQLKKLDSEDSEEGSSSQLSGEASNSVDDDNNNEKSLDNYLDHLDSLFLSSITNFSTKLNTKLSYELHLAKLVFLAPLITFGNSNVENEKEDNSQKDLLNNILNQKNEEIAIKQQTIDHYEKISKQFAKLIHRLKSALTFTDLIANSIPIICILLNSRNITDVQEAINFFTYAYKMEIENSILGIQKMLKLIFTKEKTIKDALLEAFTEIYLNYGSDVPDETDAQDEQRNSKKYYAFLEVKNLSNMISRLNQGELVCAEALIQEIFLAKKFNQTHLQILWERYAMKLSNTTEEDSRIALIIIGMLASAQPTLIQNENNLANIISISLESRCHDYRLVADTCEVLLKAFKLPSTESMEHFFKLPQDHLLFQRFHSIMVDSITNTENKYWFRMGSGVIKTVYYLAEKPDFIITNMIEQCYNKILASKNIGSENATTDNTQTDTVASQIFPSQKSEKSFILSNVDDIVIAHFISMLGDVAVNLLIYLDLHVLKELKIRQFIMDKEKMSKKMNLLGKKSRISSSTTSSKRSSSLFSASNDSDDEANDIIGPNSNEDPYQEQIVKICNEEILFGKGILNKFSNIVESISSDYNGDRYSFCVRLSASLTLAKFMVLSLKYTRKNRAILADILEKSKDGDIRSNAIISFGDLLVRFPNEIEHYTGKIFSCLCDMNFQVKSNALKVLTRLILADMIKPKGHISKIARLITDQDNYISSSARLFFVELGKKNNAYIYNFLPDIISNLSGSNGLEEKQFHEMIKFLFELLEKTRSTESLVTKLCQRFANSSDERLWRDLSFCLSQLQYNDRAICNLMNNFSYFADTLYCDAIYENIILIATNVRKAGTLKQDTKNLLDEMESKINEVRAKGTNAESIGQDGAVEGTDQTVEPNELNDVAMEGNCDVNDAGGGDTVGVASVGTRSTRSGGTVVVKTEKDQKRSTRSGRNTAVASSVKKSTSTRSTRRTVATTGKKAPSTSVRSTRQSGRARRRVVVDDSDDNDDDNENDDQYEFDED